MKIRISLNNLAVYLLITGLMVGCIPDSLTKFKEDKSTGTKSTSTSSSGTVSGPGGSSVAAPSSPLGPTVLSYLNGSTLMTSGDTVAMTVNTAVSLTPQVLGFESDTFLYYATSDTSTTPDSPPGTCNATTVASYSASISDSGLSINSSTGAITGTPSQYYANKGYRIVGYHVESGNYICFDVYFATKVTSWTYAQKTAATARYLILAVADSSAFTAGEYVSNSTGALARIKFVDSTNHKLYVVVCDSSHTLDGGGSGCNDAYNSTALFETGNNVDDNNTYFSAASTISSVTYAFDSSVTVALTPTFVPSNTSTYASELTVQTSPTPTSFTVDNSATASNGTVTVTAGATPIDATAYSIEISSGTGTATTQTLNMVISQAPLGLSLDESTLLKVNSLTYFPAGTPISSSGGAYGRVVEAITVGTDYYLWVRVESGTFAVSENIDKTIPYGTQRATIQSTGATWTGTVWESTPLKITHKLTVTSAVGYTEGEFIFNDSDGASNGADANLGLTYSYDGAAQIMLVNGNDLYVRLAYGSFTDAVDAGATDDVYNEAALDTPAVSLTNQTDLTAIKGHTLKLGATDPVATGFAAGLNVTNSSGASGVIFDLDDTTDYITLSVEGATTFSYDSALDDQNPYLATLLTATTVSSVVDYNAYRGDVYKLAAGLAQGSGVVYSISPSLPTGLSLDQGTGIITGTATSPSAKTTYTVTAANVVGSTQYVFTLRVHDHFTIYNVTSNAPSFIMHKTGQENFISRCRITQDQIDSSNLNDKDIVCFVEAGELDLYFSGLALKASTGFGMCEYLTYEPFRFWRHQYNQTPGGTVVNDFSACAQCSDTGNLDGFGAQAATTCSSADQTGNFSGSNYCYSDWATIYNDSRYPNCDDGTYTLRTWTDTNSDGVCDTSEATSTIGQACGGSPGTCYGGPAVQDFSAAQLNLGIARHILNSFTGLTQTWTYTSPLNGGLVTNKNLSNFTLSNGCGGTKSGTQSEYYYEMANWLDYVNTSPTPSPGTTPFIGSYGLTVEANYEFQCLDYAQDLIARIRVVVRDWDRTFTPMGSYSDKYIRLLTGTTISTNASPALDGSMGVASIYDTIGQLFNNNGDQVLGIVVDLKQDGIGSETFKIDTASTTTTLSITAGANANLTLDGQLYAPALLMDTGTTKDLFLQFYNDKDDWDDGADTAPRYNSCNMGTPSALAVYPFPALGL